MRFFVCLLLICHSWSGPAMASNEKRTFGFIEKATLLEHNLTLSAKLDTGAKSASLNATHIKEVSIDGKPYLNFIVPTKEGDMIFQCEHVGEVNIKIRAGEAHTSRLMRKAIKRPVVLMKIKLGDQEQTIRVNLTNRKRFIYPLLLGRQAIIAFNGVVDPSLKYTIKTAKMDK
ncbi:MAG: ATP-dependent zinc protease [Legionella sp.]